MHPGRLIEGRAIGYARTGGGKEIDFAPLPIRVVAAASRSLPIESKWVSDGWRSEARVIEAKYRRGIVATKNVLDLAHPTWAVPAPLLAPPWLTFDNRSQISQRNEYRNRYPTGPIEPSRTR